MTTIQIDCHDHPWHEQDQEFPECGPDNLLRMAEEFGVLIAFLPDHDHASWAWWYEITGPADNIVAFLAKEYCGNTEEAREILLALTD
jgi:hypothetical protein